MLDLSEIWNFLADNKYIFFVIVLIFGLFYCFFGLKLLKPTLFLSGFLIGMVLVMIFFVEFLIKPNSAVWLVWVGIVVGFIVGTVLGIVTIKLEKLGFFCLGGLGGFLLGLVFYNAFMRDVE